MKITDPKFFLSPERGICFSLCNLLFKYSCSTYSALSDLQLFVTEEQIPRGNHFFTKKNESWAAVLKRCHWNLYFCVLEDYDLKFKGNAQPRFLIKPQSTHATPVTYRIKNLFPVFFWTTPFLAPHFPIWEGKAVTWQSELQLGNPLTGKCWQWEATE